LGSRRGFLVFI